MNSRRPLALRALVTGLALFVLHPGAATGADAAGSVSGRVRNVATGLWERAKVFVTRVGTIILSMTVLLWFLASYPLPPEGAGGAAITYSLAGRLGQALQPLVEPLGFNWQICIALVPGMAAREVAVGALGTVYALSAADNGVADALSPVIAQGWSLATAYALLAWYVFAPQCLSTLAVVRRETNSWKYPLAMALALSLAQAPLDQALQAVAFGWAENMTQAAIKSVPLGQSAGQRMLARLAREIPLAVQTAIELQDEDRQAFNPMLAILSARHETQYSRIFRS